MNKVNLIHMKKLILALSAFCAALFTFTACAGPNLDHLNDMLDLDYSKIVLTVKDIFFEDLPLSDSNEEVSLTSVYEITYSGDVANVHYLVERFAQIDGILADESLATHEMLEGEAMIKDGLVITKPDDDVWVPIQIAGGLNFKSQYFDNIDLGDMYFTADVKNPRAFMGSELYCTDMKVSAGFIDSFINMSITYRAQSGNNVEILYEFTL